MSDAVWPDPRAGARRLALAARTASYALYDNHVAGLLDQAPYHVEHLRLGVRDGPSTVPEPSVAD
ncbi:hypothetical protein [Streptomyces sp. NPDC001089]